MCAENNSNLLSSVAQVVALATFPVHFHNVPSLNTMSPKLYALPTVQLPTKDDPLVITTHLGSGTGGLEPGTVYNKST